MESKITNIINQFGQCNFTIVVYHNNNIVFRVDKFLPNNEDLDKNIEIERLKVLEEFLNRPKLPNPDFIVIDIEEYNGANKLGCYVAYYDMLSENCLVEYELRTDYDVLESNSWSVDKETLNKWGTDDMVIVNGLCRFLNINRL